MHRSTPRLVTLAGLALLGAVNLAGCGAASKIAQPAALNQAQSNDAASEVGTPMYADGRRAPCPRGSSRRGPLARLHPPSRPDECGGRARSSSRGVVDVRDPLVRRARHLQASMIR
jgi:hypothetical protein